MTLSVNVSFPCPRCQVTSPVELYSSVNVTHTPQLRSKVLEGTISLFQCRACGHQATVEHDLRYHDMQAGFVIQQDTHGTLPESALGEVAPGVVSRLVRHRDALVEKVLVFEAQLDDRAIELVKLLLTTQEPRLAGASLYFSGADEQQITLVARVEGQRLALQAPRSALDSLEKSLRASGKLGDQPRWGVVDQGFARGLLDKSP